MTLRSIISFDVDNAEIITDIDGKIGSVGDDPAGLAIAFVNSPGPESAIELFQRLRSISDAPHFLGCTAMGIIGEGREIEDIGGASIVAGTIPDATISGFHLGDEDLFSSLNDADSFSSAIGLDTVPKLFIILVDPFSTPTRELLAAFNRTFPGIPVVGGIASGGSGPRRNIMALDDSIYNSGTVGFAVGGEVEIDVIVSQGCQAVGPLMEVTKSRGNVITELEGEAPLQLLHSAFADLGPRHRSMVQDGLLLGVVADKTIEEPGPGDFLIRNVLGVDESSGALTVTEFLRPGQKIRFFARDAQSAIDDLELLLSPQAFSNAPSLGLLFTCNGRGTRLFGHPDGDIKIVMNALGKDCPVAGFVCAGEIGPIGAQNYIHGQTASIVLIRSTPRPTNKS